MLQTDKISELLKEGYQQTEDGDIVPPLHLIAEDTGDYTKYKIWGTPIEGVIVWERHLYPDNRGYYQELSKADEIEKVIGRPLTIKQVSLSFNESKGVLRGIHAEPMDKLVTPLTGKVFIALADIRPSSPTFSKYVVFVFDLANHRKPKKTLVVSNGLGNSFLTLGDEEVMYLYQISEPYKTSEGKRSVKWDDPDLNIPWPIKPLIMSPVDASGNKSLRELFPEKFK